MLKTIILIGYLGTTPELRYPLDGKPVSSFKLATNEVISKPNVNKETITELHHIVTYYRKA